VYDCSSLRLYIFNELIQLYIDYPNCTCIQHLMYLLISYTHCLRQWCNITGFVRMFRSDQVQEDHKLPTYSIINVLHKLCEYLTC